ncbi:MAG: type II CAAX endopeptidase family protein [Terriglobia bacterium]|jgi:membrane protease YdiL (CAAX protease family)
MPIKLTSKEYRIITMAILVAAASLAIGVKYFWRAFPEAAIDFRVTRDDSEPIARQFLAGRNIQVAGYRHAAAFQYDDEGKVYLERTQGLERMNQLTRGPIRVWRWAHRWFRPQQKEEYQVAVTPAGEVVGFLHEMQETAPGANLDPDSAQGIAENFLRDVMKRDLNDLEFVEKSTNKREARTDHSFIWKQKSVNLGDGSLRVEVDVNGDQVSGYHEFIKVPDQWSRDYARLRSRNETTQVVDQVFLFLLGIFMLVVLVQRIRERDVPVRMALAFALVATVLYFLGHLNNFSLEEFGYTTTDAYASFVTRYVMLGLLAAVAWGAFVFYLVASSEPVYRQAFPRLQSLRGTLSWKGLRSRSFFMANVVGIGLTFFFFAYQTIFYLAANKLGAWAPAEVNYSDLLNTRIPWVWVLFIGFIPAVFEELMFRAFAIPFLNRFLRSAPLAIVFAAFIWGFGHAAYPNQPFFIRGLEVGLGGIVIGIMMLRFGVVATMIWHYSVDALYTAFLLLRSHNHYLMASGGVTAGIMLVPLLLALIAYLQTGTFAEEESLTNASATAARPPGERPAPATQAEAPLAYQPLSQTRLALAAGLVVIFLALASIKVYRFGENIKLKTTRQDAFRLADDFLKARHVDPSRYHRAAWLRENLDGSTARYLLERRSVEETDRIYRQATRLALWEVRLFRPLEKEEYEILVDAEGARVFAYKHVLDAAAAGASLSMDEARALAEKAVQQEGYRLADFDLQENQGEKKKARQDYTFVWQAKPADPRNVDEEHYRLEVNVAGDQVVSVSRFFKLPDEWVRQREALTMSTIALGTIAGLLYVGLSGGALIILVKQIRSGRIPWRAAGKVGIALAVIAGLGEINALPTLDSFYQTSIPLSAFHLVVGVSLLLGAAGVGLGSWVLVGLATSLYPDAWRIFQGAARRVWRRDALVAIVVSISAGAALGQVRGLVENRFHAYFPVSVGLVPDSFDAARPAVSFFLRGLESGILYAASVAVIIYLVRFGLARREWWIGVLGLIFIISRGSPTAHSVREFMLTWGMGMLTAVAVIGILALFFRDNVLAYIGTAFLAPILTPMISLLSEPPRFFRWDGGALAVVTLLVMGWLFLAGRGSEAVPLPPADFRVDSSLSSTPGAGDSVS